MYKPNDFRKICPVCQALSKSLTKKKCDFCKCDLESIAHSGSNYIESKYGWISNWTFRSIYKESENKE